MSNFDDNLMSDDKQEIYTYNGFDVVVITIFK